MNKNNTEAERRRAAPDEFCGGRSFDVASFEWRALRDEVVAYRRVETADVGSVAVDAGKRAILIECC